MEITKPVIECPFDLHVELRSQPDAEGTPYHRDAIAADIPGLIEETFVRGVLEDCLPSEVTGLHCSVSPVWESEPLVQEIEIRIVTEVGAEEIRYTQRYSTGPWVRRSIALVRQLREERTLAEGASAYPVLFAEKNRTGTPISPPDFEAPVIVEESLDDFGVRALGEGSLVPDRPILMNARTLEEAITLCTEAGTNETGGAMLGKLVRVPEALPGTTSRVVTILSTTVLDPRHVGVPNEMRFDPEALVEASRIAEMRGKGEEILTVIHTHGWGKDCGHCNENENCPLTECSQVSTRDYQLIESLFPSKAAVMPIVGRKLGAKDKCPVLAIHAWRDGALRPMRWRTYQD